MWKFDGERVREGDILVHCFTKEDGVSDTRPRIMKQCKWCVATEEEKELAYKEIKEYKEVHTYASLYSGRILNAWYDDCPQYVKQEDGSLVRNPPILDEDVLTYFARIKMLEEV